MENTILLLTALFILLGCSDTGHRLRQEIALLKTDKQKQTYLEAIWETDQEVRKNATKAQQEYGYKSDQHREAVKAMIDTDRLHRRKVLAYLEVFGYPDPQEVGGRAAGTPHLVFHHTVGMGDPLEDYKILIQAVRDGKLELGSLSWFLHRVYSFEYNEDFRMASPYRPEAEVEALIGALGWQAY